MRPMLAALSAVIIGVAAVRAQTTSSLLEPEPALEVQGTFAGEKAGETAEDLSGIACIPPGTKKLRHCLVVNDQNRTAQFATFENRRISAGRVFNLIGKDHDTATLGPKPEVVSCPGGQKRFKDLDGEGVAYAKPFFYVVGSHGCSRKDAEFRESSFILARVRVDDEGRVVDASGKPVDNPGEGNGVETSYRLTELLRGADGVREFFGKRLQRKEKTDQEPNGLNVEGIAVVEEDVFVGLRGPSLEGKAFIVRATLAELFAKGYVKSGAAPSVVPLALGPSIGIRDLASRQDGSLLVLAGPAQEQDLPYSLFLAEPSKEWKLTLLGALAPVNDPKGDPAKAEGMTILEDTAEMMRVLVVFDGLPNGGPRTYRVPLR